MKADIVTIFPDFFRGPLDYGITRRAQELGLAKIEVHDLRDFAQPRHDARRPIIEQFQVLALERELVLSRAVAASDADVLHRLKK